MLSNPQLLEKYGRFVGDGNGFWGMEMRSGSAGPEIRHLLVFVGVAGTGAEATMALHLLPLWTAKSTHFEPCATGTSIDFAPRCIRWGGLRSNLLPPPPRRVVPTRVENTPLPVP